MAEAQDLDLMEDYRKSQQEQHLELLWQRVFRFEWAVDSDATRVHPHPIECPPEICNADQQFADPAARAKAQFLMRARFALQHPQPQARQRYYLGIDLRFLEDWRNGAFFDHNDTKLVEQFDASATLEAIKREVGYGHLAALADLPMKSSRKFWFAMISRVISIHVGDAVGDLNQEFGTDYFNAQAILWPGEDREPWLDQFPSAHEELLLRRRQILNRIFGRTAHDAQRMLDRLVLPSFWLATKLRVRYDPEYLDESLGYNMLSDLEELGLAPHRNEAFRAFGPRAASQWETLREFLQIHHPELLAPSNAESLRAVRIAAHTDRGGLGRLLQQYAGQTPDRSQLVEEMGSILDEAQKDRKTYSVRLMGLRVHHELTRLHYLGYRDLLSALRDSGPECIATEGQSYPSQVAGVEGDPKCPTFLREVRQPSAGAESSDLV